MKHIIYLLALMFVNMVSCQMTVNIIPKTDYNNITINGKTLMEIEATQGDAVEVETLFSATIQETQVNSDPFHPSYGYVYDGLDLGFSGTGMGDPQEIELSSFEITTSDWSFTIQGKTVFVGDDISLLGEVVFNSKKDGSKGIIYQYCDGCNNYIGINFNKNTKKITKIYFIEMT